MDDAAKTRRAALTATLLNIAGVAISFFIWRDHENPLLVGTQVLSIGASAVLAALLAAGPPQLVLAETALLLNVVFLLPAHWVSADRQAAQGIPWTPFQPHGLGAFTIALLAPPALWVGLAGIGLFVVAAIAQYLSWSDVARASVATDEPWPMIIYGAFAVVLLWHARRRARAEERAAAAEARAQAEYELARFIMSVRDLANTPLQTILLATTLLREHPGADADALVARIDRALGRLRELDEFLVAHEQHVDHRPAITPIESRAPPR